MGQRGPSSAALRLLVAGSRSPWPFLLQGCSLSTASFLQADCKQGPPPAPSGNAGGLSHAPGEFWKERQGGPPFLPQRARLQN